MSALHLRLIGIGKAMHGHPDTEHCTGARGQSVMTVCMVKFNVTLLKSNC